MAVASSSTTRLLLHLPAFSPSLSFIRLLLLLHSHSHPSSRCPTPFISLSGMVDVAQSVDELRLKLDSVTIDFNHPPNDHASPTATSDLLIELSSSSSVDALSDQSATTVHEEDTHDGLDLDAHESMVSQHSSSPLSITKRFSSPPEQKGDPESKTFDNSITDFHGSYDFHSAYPLLDHNYAMPAFSGYPYIHTYPAYSFQGYHNPAADYTLVSQPFPGSMSSEAQFSSQGDASYAYVTPQVVGCPGAEQAPAHTFQCAHPQVIGNSPYNPPSCGGSFLALNSQAALAPATAMPNGIPNMGSYALSIPALTFPPGGIIVLDSCQPGNLAVSTTCPRVNDVTDPIQSSRMPPTTSNLQASVQKPLTASKLRATADLFTPALGFSVTATPPYNSGAIPPIVAYPSYNDGNKPAGSMAHSAFSYSPANSVQSYGSLIAMHLTPKNRAFRRRRAPLQDVTTNFNAFKDDSAPHSLNVSVCYSAANKSRFTFRRACSTGGFPSNNKRSVVACEKPEMLAKELKPYVFSLEQHQYNRPDFITEYEDAECFIIKSFSEANVRQSVRHKVWSSTHNGNRKLDQAYENAKTRGKGKTNGCPVFLFFSVNGSGQFCGVAEMVGRVDYNNTMEFWDQERWSGSFPVKWHIIKNVPNFQFHGIILQDNENKPVTNSRDTQAVNFQQGLQMLNIFKNYYARSWILNDFNIPQCCHKTTQESPEKCQNTCEVGAEKESEKVASPDVKGEATEIIVS